MAQTEIFERVRHFWSVSSSLLAAADARFQALVRTYCTWGSSFGAPVAGIVFIICLVAFGWWGLLIGPMFAAVGYWLATALWLPALALMAVYLVMQLH